MCFVMLHCIVVDLLIFRRMAVPLSTWSRSPRREAAREDGVCYVGKVDEGGER
jgi:hypothetical protein